MSQASPETSTSFGQRFALLTPPERDTIREWVQLLREADPRHQIRGAFTDNRGGHCAVGLLHHTRQQRQFYEPSALGPLNTHLPAWLVNTAVSLNDYWHWTYAEIADVLEMGLTESDPAPDPTPEPQIRLIVLEDGWLSMETERAPGVFV